MDIKNNSFTTLNDAYITTLNKLFSNIVFEMTSINLSDYNYNTLIKGSKFIDNIKNTLEILQQHSSSINTMITNCSELVNNISESINKDNDYVSETPSGILVYNSIMYNKIKANKKKPILPIKNKTIIIPKLNYKITLPVVNKLSEIPECFYYLNNADNKESDKSNIYVRINNNIIEVPFPEIIDNQQNHNRNNTIRCKYYTLQECINQRNKMSKLYNSNIRECKYAHCGEPLIKIGNIHRCPSLANFGNPATFNSDIKFVSYSDIKNMLLYSLNDLAISMIWLYENKMERTEINDLILY